MKKIIAIGVAMAVILVLASAGPVAATNSSGTLVEPGDSDGGLQCALLPVGPTPIGYINTNSIIPPVCDIGEYVYIDVDAVGLVSVGDVRLTDVTFGGITYEAGTQVANVDLDLGRVLTVLALGASNLLIRASGSMPNPPLIVNSVINSARFRHDFCYNDLKHI